MASHGSFFMNQRMSLVELFQLLTLHHDIEKTPYRRFCFFTSLHPARVHGNTDGAHAALDLFCVNGCCPALSPPAHRH